MERTRSLWLSCCEPPLLLQPEVQLLQPLVLAWLAQVIRLSWLLQGLLLGLG